MIYVILGQTASGKTSLALSLARKLSLPILSADAFQCCKEMNIGTDKPSDEMVEGIDYLFRDELSLEDEVSAYYFQKKYRPLIEKKVLNNEDIIITGGTFLYIKALLFDYHFQEEDNSDSKYRNLSLKELQDELLKRNQKLYEEIDHDNPRRLVRALEQLDEGIDRDEILSFNDGTPLYPTRFFKIKVDVEEGNRLIEQRVNKMFEEGLLEEVKDLVNKHPLDSRGFQAVGYKEVISGLKSGKSIEEIKEDIKVHTRQYAKRQRTFMRTQFPDVKEASRENIYNLILQNHLLKERSSLLYKEGMLAKIEGKKVLLAGLGGVGSSCLSSLLRLGFSDFTIIDYDYINESNINRQQMYDFSDVGKEKTKVCQEKSLLLNPLAKIKALFTKISCQQDLPDERFDIIIDAIDDPNGKTLLYLKAKKDSSLFISSQGLGFHFDSTKVRYGKLSEANDPLSRNFKASLMENKVSAEEIDDINIVHAAAGKIKGKKNSKVIGSLSTAPVSGGLAITSFILKSLYEEANNEKN